MLTKIKNKVNNMSKTDWIQVGLWLFTLVLLLIFVVLAATLNKDAGTVDKTVAAQTNHIGEYQTHTNLASGGTFTETLHGVSVKHTVVSVIEAAKGKYLVNIDAYTYLAKGATYATVLAAVGGIFVLSLFGSLVTTTVIAHRRGGKK